MKPLDNIMVYPKQEPISIRIVNGDINFVFSFVDLYVL